MAETQKISKKINSENSDDGPGLGDLTYGQKVRMLEDIIRELLELVQEFAPVAGRYAELKAQITVRKEIKSALQSAIRAERAEM